VDEDQEPCTHDVVVVGGSAGSVEAALRLVRGLPADLPAALFVAIHRGPERPTYLAELLDAAGPLTAVQAEEGMPVRRGRIYVAPPDRHLLVGRDHVHVRRGPKENRTRSAAVTCTTRVVGVILSGALDDGTAGLLAVRRCGGIGVAQDPGDAEHAAMPASAIANGAVDHVRPVAGLASLLARLAQEPCGQPVEPPDELRMEALIAAQELIMDPEQQKRLGTVVPLTCPECHGALYEIREDGFLRFRCHTGHAFTADALRSDQEDAWERALYQALASQEEQLTLLRKMAEDARERGLPVNAQSYEQRARGYEEGAEIIRALIAGNGRRAAGPGGDPARPESGLSPRAAGRGRRHP
jgi:two-component system, chemotaxis family, protein-glutamate methylesterase/glutaminase